MKNKTLIILILFLSTIASNAQTLQNYLDIAKENSSELKINNYEYELAKEKVLEVGNNSKTSFNFGYFIQRPETRVGSQVAIGGVRQQFPWFGTKNSEREVAKSNAEVWQYDLALSERDLIYKVKEAYYKLYEKQAITSILMENKQILKTYENMALAALENNKATFSDVSLIRVERNELHSNIFQNYNEIEALSKNFNRLLQRDINLMVNVVDSLNITDILIGKTVVDHHPSLDKIDQINEALDLNKNISYQSGIANNLNNIGNVLCDKGKMDDLDDALVKYEESFKIMEEIKDKAGMALSLCNIGITLIKKMDFESFSF